MRVLITNSLVLVAISLAPSASAAPYTTSSVDSYESYPNSTALAQESGPSSVPNVRRDEVIHVQSLYDGSPFGDVFGSVAHFFDNIGMNTISDSMPLTETQKAAFDQLQNALNDAAGNVIANLPISSLSSRSLEDRQIPTPLSTLGNLPGLGSSLTTLSDLLSSIGIGANPTALTDSQKQVLARIQTAINNAVGDVAANAPRLSVLPFSHQARSVQERSLGDIVSVISQVPVLSSVFQSVNDLLGKLDVLDGISLDDFDDTQKEALRKLRAEIDDAVQNIETQAHTVRIEHTRGEHGHWDHHDQDHDLHKDDHHSHDEHKDLDKSSNEPKGENRPRDAHKVNDTHVDDHKPHHVHKDDHDVQNTHRKGDSCREPRDGQRVDCKNHEDGRDKDKDSSLIKINLGHSHHP